MTPLAALAAAVRDRLLAGADAPLPGIGTLARAHVSARLATGPGGERLLMPPGEAVRLLGRMADPTDLAQALARYVGGPPEAAAAAFRDAVDQLDARLAVTGDARLDGVGVFQRTSSGIRFAAAPEVLADVNRAYAGLVPVAVAPAAAPALPAASPAPLAPLPPLPDEPPGAVDILLDLIVNEPAEAGPAPRPTAEDAPEPQAPPPPLPSPAQSAFTDEPADVPAMRPPNVAGPPAAAPVSDLTGGSRPSAPAPAESERTDPLVVDRGGVDPVDEPGDGSGAALPAESRQTRYEPLPPADWHPAPLADLETDDTRPLDRLDEIEDAEVLDSSPMPDALDADALDAAAIGTVSVATDLLPDPPPRADRPDTSEELADSPADGAASRRSEEPGPDATGPDVTAPAAPGRPERRAWAFLYAAAVLSLSALVLYWFIDERRPPVETAAAPAMAPATAIAPLPAADSLAARPDTSAPAPLP